MKISYDLNALQVLSSTSYYMRKVNHGIQHVSLRKREIKYMREIMTIRR